ncbi:hypothetical protein D1BOALGB6SA_4259 [Olavius sp. associated proteobacterium Delta 1]|nr:hypothetical protein D1BOALGB6SA_4259 [Olavius sp. associated proteobacterium Delta 1]
MKVQKNFPLLWVRNQLAWIKSIHLLILLCHIYLRFNNLS